MDKRENKGIGLNTKPKKLVKQLALALGLGMSVSGAWAACNTVGNEYICDGTLYEGALKHASQHDKVTINTSVPVGTQPMQGYGMYIDHSYTYKQVSITTTGDQADAIMVKKTTNSTFGDGLYIKTSGASADGINLAEDTPNGGSINVGNNAQIETQFGMGIRVNNSTGAGYINSVTVGDNLTVTTHGTGSNGFDAYGYGLYSGSRTWKQADRKGLSELRVGKNASITTNGGAAHAVYANAGGFIQLGDNANITTNKTNAYGLYAQTSSSGGVSQAGKIDLLGGATITSPTTALYSSGVGSKIASYNSDTGAETSGVFNIQGGMIAAGGGAIDLRMVGSSSITGDITSQGANSNINLDLKDNTVLTGKSKTTTGGVFNLNMAGSSSKWNVTGDSNLTELNLADNAQVILGDSARHAGLDPATRVILTVDKLSGNGKFYLTVNATRDGLITNYDDEKGDRLIVTGEATGRHKIAADDQNTGAVVVSGSEVLRLVDVQNSTGASDAVFELENGYVDIGAYKFDLKKEDAAAGAANWVLSARAGGPGTGGLPGLTNIAQHTAGILSTNYLLGHVETQTLLQRMGELRQGDSSGDVWGRVYTGKLSSFENKRLSSYGMDYNGMQIGVDRRLDASENATVYIGGVVGYGKGEVDYAIGSGQTDSYHVGAYGTYKADNGFYVDGIVKYSHMKNEVNTLTGGGYAVNGKGNTNGFSIGVEAGKRFYTSGKQQGFYVEPQGQLTFGQQNGATINSSNGLRTDLDSYTSILGRASVILGYDISQGKNPINVYFKTGYVKEFDGKTSYTFNRFNKEKYDFDGGWWDNGIGVNVQLAERHHIYAEANYARGGSFDKKQVNMGYRYSF